MILLNITDNKDVIELEYDGHDILYHKTMGVLSIRKENRDIATEYQRYFIYNDFGEYMNHLYDNEDFMITLGSKINELFDLADSIQQKDGMASCHIATFAFQSCTVYTQYLKFFNLYHNAIKFLIRMLNFATLWENKNKGKELHKGAVYGYLGEMFMHVLDYEMGFTYLHRSVKEDIRIKKFIPTYPEDAPSYKIMNLKGSVDHFMSGYVKSVREDLNSHLGSFSKIFTQYEGFTMAAFDEAFIDNKFYNKGTLEDIKASILYCIWSKYYYKMKVAENVKTIGTFDNLNRVNKLFTLCVSIEMLSKELGIAKRIMGANQKRPTNRQLQEQLYLFLGGSKNKFEELFPEIDGKDNGIQQLIKDLLQFEKNEFNKKTVQPLERCIMLYILTRNFTAHNVKSIDTIGNHFFDIFKALLYLLFVLIIESKNKGLTQSDI